VVAVTGASSPAGRAVVAALQRVSGPRPAAIRRIIAIEDSGLASPAAGGGVDVPPVPAVSSVQWMSADLGSPQVADALAGAQIVVHVAAQDQVATERDPMTRRAQAIRAAQAVITAAAAIGAQRLIVVTSAMVFGARPGTPQPLAEDHAGRAEPDDGVAADLIEVERILERAPRVHPGLAVTLIRPAALVGPAVDTALTRYFEAPRLLVLRGQQMAWQFCHLDDLASAVHTVIEHGLTGQLTVASPGTLDEAGLERISGMRRLEVPLTLAFSTAERLHRMGVLHAPASELAYVVHPWSVGSQRLTAAGWEAAYDNEACLRVLLHGLERRQRAGHRVDRREAAMGAAGAAVALVGTAAILRQARTRRGRRPAPRLEP
jgi:nucleoside-diphosphate-sugar epimerase